MLENSSGQGNDDPKKPNDSDFKKDLDKINLLNSAKSSTKKKRPANGDKEDISKEPKTQKTTESSNNSIKPHQKYDKITEDESSGQKSNPQTKELSTKNVQEHVYRNSGSTPKQKGPGSTAGTA